MTVAPGQTTIGFVGMGNMGVPMAACLAGRGFDLVVTDIDRSAAERFHAAHGGRVVERADIAADVDVLILMLPNGKIVRDFLLGGDAPPARSLKPGSIVIDMSSSAPTGTRELGATLQGLGISLVDAPVSGGVKRAQDGTLAIITGGDEALLQKLAPIFEAMAKSVIRVGPLGSGHAMKALNNYVSATGLIAACEALRVAQQFGIDGPSAINVLNASTGRSNSTEHKLGQFVFSEAYNSGFTLGLMRKDLATAIDLAKELHIDLPLGEHVVDIWQDAEKRLGGSADHTEIDRMIGVPGREAGAKP